MLYTWNLQKFHAVCSINAVSILKANTFLKKGLQDRVMGRLKKGLGSVNVKKKILGNFQGLISKLHVGGGSWELTAQRESDPGGKPNKRCPLRIGWPKKKIGWLNALKEERKVLLELGSCWALGEVLNLEGWLGWEQKASVLSLRALLQGCGWIQGWSGVLQWDPILSASETGDIYLGLEWIRAAGPTH